MTRDDASALWFVARRSPYMLLKCAAVLVALAIGERTGAPRARARRLRGAFR